MTGIAKYLPAGAVSMSSWPPAVFSTLAAVVVSCVCSPSACMSDSAGTPVEVSAGAGVSVADGAGASVPTAQ